MRSSAGHGRDAGEDDTTRVVLALGLFRPRIDGRTVERGMEGVVERARESFPGEPVRIVTIRDLTDFETDFPGLSEDLTEEQRQGRFQGIASGYFVQEALEGGHGITDIHFDLAGVDSALIGPHWGSELRSLLAHLRSSAERRVHIHFRSGQGLSSIPRHADLVQGAPLPEVLAKHLPHSVFPHAR